jgi:N-sulfoglucosamine sulfohydrolase
MLSLNRRNLLGGVAAAAVAAALPALAAEGPRPNILFVIADDWGWLSSRPFDELGIRMPAFDRIRRDGATFDNAFVAAPTCTASRGSILTGRPPWQLEEGANLASILRTKFETYPDLLERAGYHVGLTGKGWAPGQLGPVNRTRNPAGVSYPDFKTFLARRPGGTPFCYWFGSQNPHRPFKPGQGRENGIEYKGPMPPYFPDAPAVREDIADYIHATQTFDRQLAALLDELEATGEMARTLVVVTGDNGWAFPRAKATVYDAGAHTPLAMMWPDRIPRGWTTTSPVSLTDLGPTFLEAAGIAVPDVMTGKSLLPLIAGGPAPHRAVITAMERHMDGRTRPGEGYPMRSWRSERYLYIRNFKPERWPAGNPSRLRPTIAQLESNIFSSYADIDHGPTKAWMAAHHDDPAVRPYFERAMGKRPAQELYDVAADPYQFNNLALDPANAALVARLDAELLSELRRLGDPRVGPDPDQFDRYPPYNDPGYGRPADLDLVSETGAPP